ncbi:MAG: glycosyltransferase family 2 protein [Candidatus Heimdallarchaeaceae archaeon]
MNKKLSIVMAYYNRVEQLRFTLSTILKSPHSEDIEIIILDDASSVGQEAEGVIRMFDLDIKLIPFTSSEKTWKNPCHVFNIGFKQVTGEVIIIQNPECFHYGDVIGHVFSHVNNENYCVYSCKKVDNEMAKRLRSAREKTFNNLMNTLKESRGGWYNHPVYNPKCYHFLSAITKKNLDDLGGFDERYADGYSFDDDEFLERIKRSPLEIINVPPDVCFCVHQWHVCTHPQNGNKDEGWKRNHRLFTNVTCKETGWKANDS